MKTVKWSNALKKKGFCFVFLSFHRETEICKDIKMFMLCPSICPFFSVVFDLYCCRLKKKLTGMETSENIVFSLKPLPLQVVVPLSLSVCFWMLVGWFCYEARC